MVSIEPIEADVSGLVFEEDAAESDFHDDTARVSRSATLDGGAVVTHSGYSHGDRTFLIVGRVTRAQFAALRALYEGQTYINIACCEGYFKGVIRACRYHSGGVRLTFYVEEKISQ